MLPLKQNLNSTNASSLALCFCHFKKVVHHSSFLLGSHCDIMIKKNTLSKYQCFFSLAFQHIPLPASYKLTSQSMRKLMSASEECLPPQTLLLRLPHYFPSTPMSDNTHQPVLWQYKQCQCRLIGPMCHTHAHISQTLELSMLLHMELTVIQTRESTINVW